MKKKTVSELETENKALLGKNVDIDSKVKDLFTKVKLLRKGAKKNRMKLTVNKNIIRKRLGNSYKKFKVGDIITFDKDISGDRFVWIGHLRMYTKNPLVKITKVNKKTVRVDYIGGFYDNYDPIEMNDNISKERLQQLIIQHTGLINKTVVKRDEDLDQMMKL